MPIFLPPRLSCTCVKAVYGSEDFFLGRPRYRSENVQGVEVVGAGHGLILDKEKLTQALSQLYTQ